MILLNTVYGSTSVVLAKFSKRVIDAILYGAGGAILSKIFLSKIVPICVSQTLYVRLIKEKRDMVKKDSRCSWRFGLCYCFQ